MSSVNPVFLLPSALAARSGAIAAGSVASMALGAGQFCINPGLVFAVAGEATDRFVEAAARSLAAVAAAPMLSRSIHAAYDREVEARSAASGMRVVARGQAGEAPDPCTAVLFATDAARFLAQPRLGDEVFGAASLLVACRDQEDAAGRIEPGGPAHGDAAAGPGRSPARPGCCRSSSARPGGSSPMAGRPASRSATRWCMAVSMRPVIVRSVGSRQGCALDPLKAKP